MARLTARLEGVDAGLEDALDSVAEASRKVQQSIDSLDETVEDIQQSMAIASKSVDSMDESVEDAAESAATANRSLDELEGEVSGLTIKTETLDLTVEDVSDTFKTAAATSRSAASAIDKQGQEAMEAVTGISAASQATDELSQSAAKAGVSTRIASSGVDELGDESRETAGELIAASSAADLLSLQSSALSINVGLFTVALRNLTTQVPLLVAALGNATAAFTGLGTAIAGVGIGAASLSLAGLAAKAEELQGPIEGAGNHLQALGRIAENVKLIFIEALQPLINTEGIVDVFRNTIELAAQSLQSFGESIQYAFETSFASVDGAQSLAQTMAQISDSVRENMDRITEAVTRVVLVLGDDLAGIVDSFLSGLPGFLRGVTEATEELISIFSIAGRNIGRFVSELTELGRAVLAGAAPVLSEFFGVIATVAAELNELGGQTIATAVKIGALVVALNRLAGIAGSIALPFTQATANILNFASQSTTALGSFTRTLAESSRVLTGMSGGIGRLSVAFQQVLPPLGESTSVFAILTERLEGTSKSGGAAAVSMRALGSSASNATADTAGLNVTVGSLVSRLKALASTNISASLSSSITSLKRNLRAFSITEFIASITVLRRSLHGLAADGLGIVRESFDEADGSVEGLRRSLISLYRTATTAPDISSALSPALGDEISDGAVFRGNLRRRITGDAEPSISAPRMQRQDALSQLDLINNRGAREQLTGFSGLKQNLYDLISTTDEYNDTFSNTLQTIRATDVESNLGSGIQAVSDYMDETAGVSNEFSRNIIEAGQAANFSEESLEQFQQQMHNLAASGRLADMSQDELQEELVQTGFNAKQAELAVDGLNDELVENAGISRLAAIKQSVMTGTTTTLKAALSGLAVTVGAVSAAILVLAAVGGTVVALLSTIGSSGKGAKEIIEDIKTALLDIGQTAMPFFITSGEMMLDIFRSMSAVGAAIIGVLQDIGQEFGFIQSSIDGASGPVETITGAIKAFNDVVTPLLASIGDLSRIIAGRLIVSIRRLGDSVVSFIDTMRLPEVFNASADAVGYLARNIGGLSGVLRFILDIISTVVTSVVKLTAVLGLATAAAIVATGGFSALAASIWSAIAGITVLGGVVSGPALAIGALITAVAVLLDYLGILDLILDSVFGTFSMIMDVMSGVVSVFGDVGSSILSVLGPAISFIVDSIGGIIDTFNILFNVGMSIIKIITDIARLFGGTLLDTIIGLSQALVNVFIDTLLRTIQNIDFLKNAVDTLVDIGIAVFDFFTGLPAIIDTFVQGMLQVLEDGLNDVISQINGISNFFNEQIASRIKEVPEMGTLDEVELTRSGELAEQSQNASSAARRARPDDSSIEGDSVSAGAGIFQQGAENVVGDMGRGPNVEVNEGDTTNVFNQNISADPESKAQIGRIAKDAMEEANSFKRRQEGSQ